MADLFKNQYKVYLYKYNYKAMRDAATNITWDDKTTFLFESFISDLYTLGIPSEYIKSQITNYNKYVKEYFTTSNNIDDTRTFSLKNTNGLTTYTAGKTSTTSTASSVGSYEVANTSSDRSTRTVTTDNTRVSITNANAAVNSTSNTLTKTMLQYALAQNYALQQLQKDYEDAKMQTTRTNTTLNWMHVRDKKETYDNYIEQTLKASANLLAGLFDNVIDEINEMQNQNVLSTSPTFVQVIELTDLTTFGKATTVSTNRTVNEQDLLGATTQTEFLKDQNCTNAVSSIGAINTSVNQLSNFANLTLRQHILLQHNIKIEPNDIIEIVSNNFNIHQINSTQTVTSDDVNQNTQFIGFVTSTSVVNTYGTTSDINVTCEGISKMLALNSTISSNAVSPQFTSIVEFIAGNDKTQQLSDAANVNVYNSYFSGKTAYDLFILLLGDVLACSPLAADETQYTLRLVSDTEKLKTLPYQYAKPLLILYHYAVTISTKRECSAGTNIIIARIDNNIQETKLQAYLYMIRAHYDLFWSNCTTPYALLQTLTQSSFLEIFEDRSGIIVMRPARYNTWFTDDIIDKDQLIDWKQSINDSILKSRTDYKWSIPAIGVQNEFSGGYYQDITALLKYGFRADSPKDSPSVQSEIEAAIFSALDVTKANGETRKLSVTVPMIRTYKVGHLYYFPLYTAANFNKSASGVISTGFVGYLTDIKSAIVPGNTDAHNLEFSYLRTAELLELDAINTTEPVLAADNLILNFKHLPDLEIFINLFKQADIPTTADASIQEKVNKFVSQANYYWASFNKTNKQLFDTYITKNDFLLQSTISSLFLSMYPTTLTHDSFLPISTEAKPTQFYPTQQLINAIWLTDTCIRNRLTSPIIPQKQQIKYFAVTTADNKTNDFINYINKDATFNTQRELTYIQDVSGARIKNTYLSINAPYAYYGKGFLHLDSLTPSTFTLYADTLGDAIKTFMNVTQSCWQNLSKNSSAQQSFIESQYKTIGVSDISARTQAANDLNTIKQLIIAYQQMENNAYTYTEFQTQLNKATDELKKFVAYNKTQYENYWSILKQNVLNAASNTVSYSLLNLMTSTFGSLIKGFTDSSVISITQNLATAIAEKFLGTTKVQMLIPAVTTKNTKIFSPINNFHKNTTTANGAYITGVSPINYTTLFTNMKNSIKERFSVTSTGGISLTDTAFKDATGSVIGTIVDVVYDATLSTAYNCLVYYPVVEFLTTTSKNLYPATSYMLTKAELQAFAATHSSSKKLPGIILLDFVQIPQNKIPSIQVLAQNNALYTTTTDTDIKNNEAVFDISPLLIWNNYDIASAMNATIYNLLNCTCKSASSTDFIIEESSLKRPTYPVITNKSLLSSQYCCVFNANVNVDSSIKFNITELSPSTKFAIINCFINLNNAASQNIYYSIEAYNNSTNLYKITDNSVYSADQTNTLNIVAGIRYAQSDILTALKNIASAEDVSTTATSVADTNTASILQENTANTELNNAANIKESCALALYPGTLPWINYINQNNYPSYIYTTITT